MMQGRRLILPVAALALSAVPATSGCASQNPVEDEEPEETQVELLVGFQESVDEELLDRLDILEIHAFDAPPAAYLNVCIPADSDPEAVLAMIEAEPTVSFMHRAEQVFVSFHDRPTTDQPVSAADSAALRQVGGRIRFVFSDPNPSIAVVLPEGTVDALRADPAVESVVPVLVGHFPEQDSVTPCSELF